MEDDILRLWGLGLLRADAVLALGEIEAPGLVFVTRDPRDYFVYCDHGAERDADRLALAVRRGEDGRPVAVPLFHPFRYLVLSRILQVCTRTIVYKPDAASRDGCVPDPLPWPRPAPPRLASVEKVDELVSAAVAGEPCAFLRLFRSVRSYGIDTHEIQIKRIKEHRERLLPLFRAAGREEIAEVHRELCDAATQIDPNKVVHTILRLTDSALRLEQVQGRLGGAILVDTMAEIVRRVGEEALGEELPEEDVVGWGGMFPDVKREMYGGVRLRDGGKATNEFLRQHRLDYGVRLRWYVEGDTEYGAFTALGIPAVEVVNLRGRVVEKAVLAFRDNLTTDAGRGIFSAISVDRDVNASVKIAAKAAEADAFCGRIFFSDPDFESANFTIEDMSRAVAKMAAALGCAGDVQQKISNLSVGAPGRDALLEAARDLSPALKGVGKSVEWGRALIEVAYESPIGPGGHRRKVLDNVDAVLRLIACGFQATREKYRVGPTGELVER